MYTRPNVAHILEYLVQHIAQEKQNILYYSYYCFDNYCKSKGTTRANDTMLLTHPTNTIRQIHTLSNHSEMPFSSLKA
jgi:hypothetical protein